MGNYQANGTGNYHFMLTKGGCELGELIYKKWYAFDAEIIMAGGKSYTLTPKGFWDAKIELKDGAQTLLEFKMGWKGIMIKTFFNNREDHFLLKLKGLLGSKFVLVDKDDQELLVVESDFKWRKFNYDHTIETSPAFDEDENSALLLLTVLHCINYYMTIIAS